MTVGEILRLARWGGYHLGVIVVNDGCRRSVVFTEGMWFSQRVVLCGFHIGSAIFTESDGSLQAYVSFSRFDQIWGRFLAPMSKRI